MLHLSLPALNAKQVGQSLPEPCSDELLSRTIRPKPDTE